MTTISGRTLSEVIKGIRETKKPKKDKNGKPYFAIEEYFQRLDKAVGVTNYNIDYSDYGYTRTDSGQELYSVKCRISIIDDESHVVLYRECFGGYEVQHEHNTGREVNLQNSAEFVCNAAFKNAAKKFGIFGRFDEDSDVAGSAENAPKATRTPAAPDKGSVVNFVTAGPFETHSEKDGRPVYTLSAKRVDGERMEEQASNIIFYPNQYKGYEKELNAYIGGCKEKQYKLRIRASALQDKNGVKQYLFKGFDKAS